MSSVNIKDYKNAEYKTNLSVMEYNALVSSAVEGISNLYEAGMYGFNTYTIQSILVQICTNIDIEGVTIDEMDRFFNSTDAIDRIVSALGKSVYDRIIYDIQSGIRYRTTTNLETKQLIKELTALAVKFGSGTEYLTDNKLSELLAAAQSISERMRAYEDSGQQDTAESK